MGMATCSNDEMSTFVSEKNPFFDVVLAPSHVRPHYHLYLPKRIAEKLPRVSVPAVLRHGGKNWHVSYRGEDKRPSFRPGWKEFVDENRLQGKDACVFELMEKNEGNKLWFKVVILRYQEIPAELQADDQPDQQVMIIEID